MQLAPFVLDPHRTPQRVDGYAHFNDRIHAHALKIDVNNLVADVVVLDFLDQHITLFAPHTDVVNEGFALQRQLELLHVDFEGDGLRLVKGVENARHESLHPELAQTGPGDLLTGKNFNFVFLAGHGSVLQFEQGTQRSALRNAPDRVGKHPGHGDNLQLVP